MATTPIRALPYPLPTDPPDGSGAVYALASELDKQLPQLAATVPALTAGTLVGARAVVAGIDYRWNGSAWQPWDSDWQSNSLGVQGFAGGYGASNGWVSSGSAWRYRAGRVLYRGQVVVNGGGAVTGQVAVSIPVAARTAPGAKTTGVVFFVDSSDASSSYRLTPFINGGNMLFYTPANYQGRLNLRADANNPVVVAQSDAYQWEVEYDV
jgi:hypothetical protein